MLRRIARKRFGSARIRVSRRREQRWALVVFKAILKLVAQKVSTKNYWFANTEKLLVVEQWR